MHLPAFQPSPQHPFPSSYSSTTDPSTDDRSKTSDPCSTKDTLHHE